MTEYLRPHHLLVALLALLAGLFALGQTEYAPVPEGAYDPAVDLSMGYFVEELGDGLYWATEGTYQVIFVTTGQGVILVDAPPSFGERLMAAITSVTDEPLTHLVYSHTHADHIAGAGMLPEGLTVIAHEETARQLERGQMTERIAPFGAFVGGGPVPLPTVTFSDSYTLEVGNQVLQLDYRGINHEPGNIFVYAPQQRVLMLVDVIFPGWSPFEQLALAEDVPGYFDAHDQVLAYDFDTFIGGHLARTGSRADVETQQAYMADIQANAAQALQTVDFNAIAAEVGFVNQWALFKTYLDAVTQVCTDLTVPDWVEVLGGIDVYTYSHCATVMESLRID